MSPSSVSPSRFGISPIYGFLSPDAPATSFKNRCYNPWNDAIKDLASLITSARLQNAVDQLPLLETDKLDGESDYRRAYVVLGFLIHAWIWSSEPPKAHVPPQLSEPFLAVCKHLGLASVLSYAGLCIWNWQLRSPGDLELVNMEPLASFTGKPGEAAFYLIPVLVEYEGGTLMHLLMNAVEAAAREDSEAVRCALEETGQIILRTGKQLSKLYSTLDAGFFYHELRPFLSGGKGMGDKGLPDGVIFERTDGAEVVCKFAGGSAVQSSLFPFLDRVLGISHADLTVYQESMAYMPGAHRDFLEQVSQLPSLRSYVEAHHSDEGLEKAFNDCMKETRAWRGKHIAVVSRYIVQPAREAARSTRGVAQDSSAANGEEDEGLQGTGGSALMPFLRQARDATVGVGT